MDEAMRAEMEPHYELACRQDADRMQLHASLRDGSDPDPAAESMRDFILNGLIPASRVDPEVFRAFFRSFNMLDDPNALLTDPDVLAKAGAAHAAKDERPPAPKLGPPRDEFLAVMAATR